MIMTQIKRDAARAGSHFFDADTLRFFRSRVSDVVYGSGPFYFVTSEEFIGMRGDSHGRFYTVRKWDKAEPSMVETIGEFQQYRSRSAAHKAAARMAVGVQS
jgi:hypothetical protein